MGKSIVRSELFWKRTHGLIRYNWIVKNNISRVSKYTPIELSNTMKIIDCDEVNGYYVILKEVENICKKLQSEQISQVSIFKSLFPSNALIDYLEKFHKNNLWVIIITTTPRLVWIRWNWKKNILN